MSDNLYIGRFAPSPSGKLHIGSFLSAITSYIDAKHNNGLWKLRIDDIDSERSKKIYSENIIKILREFLLEFVLDSSHNLSDDQSDNRSHQGLKENLLKF